MARRFDVLLGAFSHHVESVARQKANPVNRACGCGLPTGSPGGGRWWRPDLDPDPGRPVRIVALHGDDPGLRRWERVDFSSKWDQHGASVNFYFELTSPYDWREIGICWADTRHAVVEVRRNTHGWVVVERDE